MAKKHRRKLKSKKTLRPKLKTATIYSIVQISFYSLAALVIISFSRQGLILAKVNEYLIYLFSWCAIFLPFIFASFGLLVSKLRTPLGSPNVIVGNVIFVISVMALSRAGILGREAWGGIETLITGFGAFVVFFASMVVGLVIMFNTSIDHVATLFLKYFKQFGLRGKMPGKLKSKLNIPAFGMKKDLKVYGENANNPQGKAGVRPSDIKQPEILEQKLVSNLPNEDRVWIYPDVSILSDAVSGKADRGDIKGNADIIEHTLESFGVTAQVVEVNLGPAVTQYALEVALGTKLSKITALEKDMARALASPTGTIRIEAPIPGRSLVGIEFPNKAPEFVPFRKMIESDPMREKPSKLAVALGLDVSGKPIVADLAKMPHVLIAGQTGSGKSVAINTFLSSMLFRASPSEVKLILVDPKRVELTSYNNIPHLLSPVIVEPNKVISALRWLMGEMDRRYKLFAQSGVRNIDAYNEMSGFQALPYIVLFIDELADIMLFSPVEVEDAITRIAQMSRATGIHMVLATQRPSVDVITGLIKANIPCRIAFAVASQVDSRVILDGQGAEKLLGRGDMLYLPPDQAKPLRIQGAFISDKDTNSLVSFLKNQGVQPQYTEEVTSMPRPGASMVPGMDGEVDQLFKDAVTIVCQYDKASSSLLQRRLSVGYARAARIMDQLEQAGVISRPEGSKPREVLIKSPEEVFAKSEASEDSVVS
ncbi:MAG: translocase FtsK protein [Candidatus Woesebacteria bacterium GW2011_GWA1_37_8]|uniref:Translocase FtsK protein n=2 Tax=Candidatus Woeseibacteriota TaxID=1752722 RepID=A0A0G0LEK2_9BACT|nr:MAG: translocase FtsK protein [Microgenomates group bacterium GW2011_GWC1_37_12b]KKQ43945.1 MAG: translocase FtsK protein [Candidatus Woesebacteria bacterium GW2011_GWA1_37_8]KKQ86360.1 MAG: translocase FtsK protein [Candidatus Woesebacteria bacterium GW2011_GWB1_38_8b]